MRHCLSVLLVLLSVLSLAACDAASNTPGPAATATTAPAAPTATPTPSISFVLFTSPDGSYSLQYPASWHVTPPNGPNAQYTFTGPANQKFQVNNLPAINITNLAPLITATCQAEQPGVAASSVQTRTASLAGQTWTRGDCDAGTPSTTDLVVEMVIYKGQVYTMDYESPTASFQADMNAFYTPMEQSFKFLS
jgi:hypothetical protein